MINNNDGLVAQRNLIQIVDNLESGHKLYSFETEKDAIRVMRVLQDLYSRRQDDMTIWRYRGSKVVERLDTMRQGSGGTLVCKVCQGEFTIEALDNYACLEQTGICLDCYGEMQE